MLYLHAGLKSCKIWLNQQCWTYLHSNCLQIKDTAKNKSWVQVLLAHWSTEHMISMYLLNVAINVCLSKT